MKTRTLTLIISLMCFSLIGTIGVQAYWVRQAWQTKEAQFDQQVNDALNHVVAKLEEKETATIVKQHLALQPVSLPRVSEEAYKPTPAQKRPEKTAARTVAKKPEKVEREEKLVFKVVSTSTRRSADHILRTVPPDSPKYFRRAEQDLASIAIDSFRFPTRLNTDSLLKNLRYENVQVINLRSTQPIDSLLAQARKFQNPAGFSFFTDTLMLPRTTRVLVRKPKALEIPELKKEAAQKKVIYHKQQEAEKVMEKMVVEMIKKEVPLQKRLQLKEVDSLLETTLQNKGINLAYNFQVTDNNLKLLLKNEGATNSFEAEQGFYKVSLFPNDLVRKPENLLLQFPDKKQYVLSSMGTMLGVSTFFTLIILGTFGTTLHFIFRQKKISEIKSDFINNMTHEFKTPIATISLATDAINSPKVLQDQQRIVHYTRIIQQENKRMLSQVENVLQMAQLDKQELNLNREIVNLHEILKKAAAQLKLQIENRKGTLNLNLPEEPVFVSADALHLENVFLNLLDNANKYSPENPVIKVNLEVQDKAALVFVSDHGIGMSSEAQRRVFDKFYRVPTGNLHDVKGFGLGLSYVKTMVQLHQGQVLVKSALGKGSTFQVILPTV